MRLLSQCALFETLLLLLLSCGNYNKDNTTAAFTRALAEKEAIRKQHPGLHTIEILDMKFQPATLTIVRGDTVVWVNKDLMAHDVTESAKRSWTSGRMEAAGTWQKVMTESADYFCSLHLVMKGKIIVEGEMP